MTQKQCEEQTYAYALSTTCTAAATAMGNPELAPVCQYLSGPVAKYTIGIVKWTGTAMQDAVMKLIPDSLTAQANFSPNIAANEMWQGENLDFPIRTTWNAAIQAVQAAWEEARKVEGLPTAPLRIRADFLIPAQNKIKRRSNSTKMVDGAENCLYAWLYALQDHGWNTQEFVEHEGDTDGNVFSTSIKGRVEDMSLPVPGGDLDVWIGKGPFGLYTTGWPTKCSDFCHRSFRGHVAMIWANRLGALQKALPAVTAAAMLQVAFEKNPEKFSSSGSSGAMPIVVGVTAVSAVAAGGYAAWHFWPQIIKWASTLYTPGARK